MDAPIAIDVHTHVVPGSLPYYLESKAPPLWPSLIPAHACHQHLMIDSKIFRTLSEQCWAIPRRLQDMDGMRIRCQILSPMPELLSYWLSTRDASRFLRYVNEQIAALVHEDAERIVGFCAVPMQSIDAAVDELRYCVQYLGFQGVELGTNINGVPIGHLQFDPFFEACVELGAAVFVHPLKPTALDRLVGPPQLEQVLAFPTEVGLAAASVLTTNLIERRPTLRIAFSHGGGTLPSLLPRLERSAQTFPALRDAMTASPHQQAKRLFYDSLVFSTAALQHLVATVGESQVMVGTDYPFSLGEAEPIAVLERAHFSNEVRQKLLVNNARRFLALKPNLSYSPSDAHTLRRAT